MGRILTGFEGLEIEGERLPYDHSVPPVWPAAPKLLRKIPFARLLLLITVEKT